jgi:hypothetical protein
VSVYNELKGKSANRAHAYVQGKRAWDAKLGLESNPYQTGTEEYAKWESGWKARAADSTIEGDVVAMTEQKK